MLKKLTVALLIIFVVVMPLLVFPVSAADSYSVMLPLR